MVKEYVRRGLALGNGKQDWAEVRKFLIVGVDKKAVFPMKYLGPLQWWHMFGM